MGDRGGVAILGDQARIGERLKGCLSIRPRVEAGQQLLRVHPSPGIGSVLITDPDHPQQQPPGRVLPRSAE
jgi:hypothetical protein